MISVGLDSWIIQDGNYGDFQVGDRTVFALEFHAERVKQLPATTPLQAKWTRPAHYQVVARIAFRESEVWVVDCGLFKAFHEGKPPQNSRVGDCIEAEIYLGIDPFFYKEGLDSLPGMPALSRVWNIRGIQIETTPWLQERAPNGQIAFTRDAARESFAKIEATDAWKDDDGRAAYVLDCEPA